MSSQQPNFTAPFGPCWKQKPTLRTWPLRYVRIEGKSINVYADERDTKKRGSSIQDVTGCKIEKGVESWMLQDDKPKLVLKRDDLQGGEAASFAFHTVELRDMFYEALANLAEGRDWDESTASVVLKANRISGTTLVEWMWADAGSDFTRGLARKNPLRWTTGTVAATTTEMRTLAVPDKKLRPIDLRIKGTSNMYSFENQTDALSWLQQVQQSTSTSDPELQPEPAEGSLQPGDRYDSVCGTLDGIPRTPPLKIHGEPSPPSPAVEVSKLIRSASQEELGEIKDVVRAHHDILGMTDQQTKTTGGRMTDDPFVYPQDLDVTDKDRRHGLTDWRDCAVNGAHLGAGKAGFEASGAKGVVRRAVWKRCLAVAIKQTDRATCSGGRDGLTDEMRLFLDLAHPHIVACYGILKEPMVGSSGESAGLTENSIVTERCQTSLQEFLNDGTKWADLTPDQVDLQKYTILTHVSLGLQKLHDMSILHRDIKCNNVLLDGKHTGRECESCGAAGRWKICDFGEAKVLKSDTTGDSDPAGTISRPESDTSVTPGYASPELLNGEGIGLPSDIYSFGILCWEVFTRQEAWHWVTGRNKLDVITSQVMMQNRRPKIPHGLAQGCAEKIRRCIGQNPSRRPPAREMTDWLEQCRREKLMSLKKHGPVRERQVHRPNQKFAAIVDPAACSVCGGNKCLHWTKAGRYSIHLTWLEKREINGVERMSFNLRFVPESIGENSVNRSWTEPDRLRDDYDSDNESDDESPEAAPPVAPDGSTKSGSTEGKPRPLGIVFKSKESEQVIDTWPKVKNLKRGQVAEQFNEFIQPGCTLLAVNDRIITEQVKFKDVFPLIQIRPLTLCFSSTEKWTDLRSLEAGKTLSYVAAAALQAGLQCVKMIPNTEQCGGEDRPLTRVPSEELSRLRDENAKLVEQLAAQKIQLDEGRRTAEGLKQSVQLLKSSRAEVQAKDVEIANLKAQLRQFEAIPPKRESVV